MGILTIFPVEDILKLYMSDLRNLHFYTIGQSESCQDDTSRYSLELPQKVAQLKELLSNQISDLRPEPQGRGMFLILIKSFGAPSNVQRNVTWT